MKQVCQGRYRYLLNSEQTDIEETWRLQDEGTRRDISSTRTVTSMGISLSVTSVQQRHVFEVCTLSWQRDENSQQQRISADYRFNANGFTVLRSSSQSPDSSSEHGYTGPFSPLMRIYNGEVIAELSKNRSATTVCVPRLGSNSDDPEFLNPVFSERQAHSLGPDRVEVDGVARDCQRYTYTGGEYGPGTLFWIDPYGIMLRYCWQQSPDALWDVILADYQPPAPA